MITEPLVSIIMPVYKTDKYIKEAINSVLNQTYNNWELIIVNDNSPDNSENTILSYQDSRIIYFKHPQNMGALQTRNTATSLAKGKYIAFLDSDDIWKVDKLQKQISFMEQNSYNFSCTSYELINDNSCKLNIKMTAPKRITRLHFLFWNWCGFLTVIYNAEKIGKILIDANIMEKNHTMRDDWAILLKISKQNDCYFLNESLALYRKREGSQSGSGVLNLLKQHYNVFRLSENMNALTSFILAITTPAGFVAKKLLYQRKMPKHL